MRSHEGERSTSLPFMNLLFHRPGTESSYLVIYPTGLCSTEREVNEVVGGKKKRSLHSNQAKEELKVGSKPEHL